MAPGFPSSYTAGRALPLLTNDAVVGEKKKIIKLGAKKSTAKTVKSHAMLFVCLFPDKIFFHIWKRELHEWNIRCLHLIFSACWSAPIKSSTLWKKGEKDINEECTSQVRFGSILHVVWTSRGTWESLTKEEFIESFGKLLVSKRHIK